MYLIAVRFLSGNLLLLLFLLALHLCQLINMTWFFFHEQDVIFKN